MPKLMSLISTCRVLNISAYSNEGNMAELPEIRADTLLGSISQEQVLLLDCRSAADFSTCHIRNSINVALPALMLRRLLSGKLSLQQVMKHLAPEALDIIATLYKSVPVVLYDNIDVDPTAGNLIAVLCQKLLEDGCSVHCLKGGFENFCLLYPEWVESSCHSNAPLIGLTSLRISNIHTSGTPCDSSLGRETPFDDLCFPVEILPHLYLGNERNSKDQESLNRHKIRYIVNVTPNLPNVFEESDTYKYMQIPISDHWSQNLASFFPKAIQFIDEARENGVGVLVHCLAGISRSVTITVAYLMYKKQLSLEDAYEYVRVKKANIAPNFNFMGQLQDFQQQLKLPSTQCQCSSVSECRCSHLHFMTPTNTRTSPDSGIEFDRFS